MTSDKAKDNRKGTSASRFDAMYYRFQNEGFTPLSDSRLGSRSGIMMKKCTDHPGYVAAVLSDHVYECKIGIVKDEKIAKKLFIYGNFVPVSLGKKAIALAIIGIPILAFGCALVGAVAGSHYATVLAGITGESVKGYIVCGALAGFFTGGGTGLLAPLIFKWFKNREYDTYGKQFLLEPYSGRKAIKFISSVKNGNYEAALYEC